MRNQHLLDWSIFITNTDQTMLSLNQVISTYKARWQIELLFKLYKSQMKLENVKGKSKSYRVLYHFPVKNRYIID